MGHPFLYDWLLLIDRVYLISLWYAIYGHGFAWFHTSRYSTNSTQNNDAAFVVIQYKAGVV